MVLKDRFPIVSGRPEKMQDQISASRALENLMSIGFLEVEEIADFGEVVRFTEPAAPPMNLEFDVARLSARITTENVIMKGLKQWGIINGLVSPGRVEIAEMPRLPELPNFGQFNWDLTAPSYTRPLATAEEDDTPFPGFVVADVLFGKRLKTEEIRYFDGKCAMLRSQDSMPRFMGLLIATNFSEEALEYGRSRGLLLTTPRNLFGEEVGEAIENLLQTLQHAGKLAAQGPEKIGRLLTDLSRIEGAAQNLRGPLFEMLVAHCIREVAGFYVEIGRVVTDPKQQKSAEIDVLAGSRRQEVLAVECKGVEPGGTVGKDEVEYWLTRRVPRIRNWFLEQEDWRNATHYFEIWTSGEFTDEAAEYLEARKRETEKYQIDFRDGSGVGQYATRAKSSDHIIATLNQHYLEHPLGNV
jgi:hypothetical protein